MYANAQIIMSAILCYVVLLVSIRYDILMVLTLSYIDLCLELAMDKPPSSVRESLRILQYVARLHKFTLLDQSVQELFSSGLF
jgi:hypothetical protein